MYFTLDFASAEIWGFASGQSVFGRTTRIPIGADEIRFSDFPTPVMAMVTHTDALLARLNYAIQASLTNEISDEINLCSSQ